MNRSDKIEYIQRVKSGEIKPLKRLPYGKYVPAPEAKGLYFWDHLSPMRFWDKYIHESSGLIVDAGVLLPQRTYLDCVEVSLIPDDMLLLFQEHKWKDHKFLLDSVDIVAIGKSMTLDRIIERELKWVREKCKPAPLVNESDFQAKYRELLLALLSGKSIAHLQGDY